jgi:hypothetical protein
VQALPEWTASLAPLLMWVLLEPLTGHKAGLALIPVQTAINNSFLSIAALHNMQSGNLFYSYATASFIRFFDWFFFLH